MAPEPPKIRGLFTALGRPAILSFPIKDWYEIVRECTSTSDCFVFEVGWYKNLGGKEEHEFLRFDILSPDEKHVAIVVAERGRGKHNLGDHATDAAQFTETAAAPASSGTILTPPGAITPPLTPPEIAVAAPTSPDVARDSSPSSAEESSSPLHKANKTSGKQEEERQQEREQCQAVEEAAKRAEENVKAADETAKREREQCEVAGENAKVAREAAKREREQREVAEENAKAADKTAKWEREQCKVAEENAKQERKQREAAEAANAKLLQELEAFRRAATILHPPK
ncbi:hypothetical protein M404DRAFT_25553 [Pisolithus tinctorius Marx 270]|uniref:Uncharacterized protein n=1 Tax=Pisolithus tinctorius Marx 270 TaxID=870435 RepID=A0A0C3PBS8_PISTI|nr:hypothetical protein M404DRAFT_25553 [Pisolithus tinctorius Marx 270]